MSPLPASGPLPQPTTSGLGQSLWLRLGPTTRLGRTLLLFPVACAVLTVGTLLYLTGFFDLAYWAEGWSAGEVAFGAVFTVVGGAGNLLGPLALVALISLGTRRYGKGMPVVTAACLVYTAATAGSLMSMILDEGSTAVLGLLCLTASLASLLVPFGVATALVHRYRSRTSLR